MRRHKIACVVCNKETRARRTTAKNIDVCYDCYITSLKTNVNENGK